MLLHSRDAAGRYVLLESAARSVGSAWLHLAASMASMAAAELMWLRGCGPVPTQPVASIRDVRDGTDARHDLWLSLARLESAREYGQEQEVVPRLKAAFGHLRAAQFLFLIASPAGPDAAMGQVRAAVDDIREVVGSMVNMLALATFATEPAVRIQL
jgi:hypothetical protein